MTTRQVEQELAAAVGIRLAPMEALAAVLPRESGRRVLLLDGLDEAGEEAPAIAGFAADLSARGARPAQTA